jgi:DNA replication protein DnaC
VTTREWGTWLQCDPETHDDLSPAIDAAGRWVEAFRADAAPRWLSLTGKTGTGKTHIASRVFRWARSRSDTSRTAYIVNQVYWPGFVSELKAGTAYYRLRDMAIWPVMFLDDIGAERDTSGFATEQLNTLLGQRMDRWTILTSNLLLPQLAAIEPRIADRIIRPPNLRAELNFESYARRQSA